MASKEKKEKVEKVGKGSNFIIVILLVVIIVGLLGLGAGFYFFGIKGKSITKLGVTANKSVSTATTTGTSTLVFSLSEEFLLNLSDQGGKNFIKTKVSVGYDNKKLTAEMTTKTSIIRDDILSVLRSKKSADFSSEKNVDDIKKEILARINVDLKDGQANNIYFDDILIQ